MKWWIVGLNQCIYVSMIWIGQLVFMNSFLNKEWQKDEIYSIFDINGFRLGLFAYKKMNEEHIFGSNCLPSIEFLNKEVLKAKISSYKLCFPLTPIGTNWVVEIIDSEGNHIELTAPIEIVKES